MMRKQGLEIVSFFEIKIKKSHKLLSDASRRIALEYKNVCVLFGRPSKLCFLPNRHISKGACFKVLCNSLERIFF